MNTKPTLFVLANGRHLGGSEKSLSALLPELVQTARIIIFVATDPIEAEFRRLNLPGLEFVRLHLGMAPWHLAWNMNALLQATEKYRPAAILANGHRGSVLLALYRFLPLSLRPRLVLYVRDFGYSTLRYTLWLMRDVLFLAPTQAVFDDVRYRSWGLHRKRHQVLGNAVPSPPETIPPDDAAPGYIGCCARIVPWKGIDYLLRAFALVAPAHPAANLHIYGEPIDPAYHSSLQKLAGDLGVAARVEFCPFSHDMNAVFRGGSFFVVPSLSEIPGPETFCRIIIEAWAHARPVIAFDCGGPRWLIEDGRDGFLVEERNVELLAQKMGLLLSNPELAREMGAFGAEKVAGQFTPAAIARNLLILLLDEPLSTPENLKSTIPTLQV